MRICWAGHVRRSKHELDKSKNENQKLRYSENKTKMDRQNTKRFNITEVK